MSLAMSFISDITFFDVAMSLVALAVIERVVICRLPSSLVGPGGWLLDTAE